MAREIYNLGRVTGLSAYELNVKHQMEEYPDKKESFKLWVWIS